MSTHDDQSFAISAPPKNYHAMSSGGKLFFGLSLVGVECNGGVDNIPVVWVIDIAHVI